MKNHDDAAFANECDSDDKLTFFDKLVMIEKDSNEYNEEASAITAPPIDFPIFPFPEEDKTP